MGTVTEIGWADSTPNFWVGCTKVGDACRDCYAVPIAANLGVGWGDAASRHRTSAQQWRAPLRWNAMRDRGQTHMVVNGEAVPVPLWMFGNSLSDFFDNHPDVAPWREEAWTKVIRPTTLLRWLLLTKRVPNVLKMLPADWDGGRNYRHVTIIASVCNQAELDRDLPRLVALKAHGVRSVGLSIEPQLGPVSIIGCPEARELDWIISGGESAHLMPPRRYSLAWPRVLIKESRTLAIPYFHKQLGSLAFDGEHRIRTRHRAGADPSEWPADLRAQEMPRVYDQEPVSISQPTLL
jgi:protein gp37